MSRPRTISITLPDGRQVVADYPPKFVMGAVKRVMTAVTAGREPDVEDAAVAWRWAETQERRHPTRPAKRRKGDSQPPARDRARVREGAATYPLRPVDLDRIRQPGTLTQLLQLEDSDPAEGLMVTMPLDEFLATRDQLADFVRDLGRSLFVILVDEESAA